LPFPDIDPVLFSIGPLVIRWYSIAYLAGVLLGVVYGGLILSARPLWRDNSPPFTPAQWMDFGFWAVLAIVVGGRLGYVLLYDPLHFAANPLQIVQTWEGGMSFHGGLVGLIVALAFFARSKKASFLAGLDLLGAVAPIGLLLGRLANFINGELFGRPTDLPWGVVFPTADTQPRHPAQLYEAALEGVVLFLVIRYFTHVRHGLRRPGLVAGTFAIGYALSRIAVETVRVPDAHIGYLTGGWLTIGMLYSLPILLIGMILVAHAKRRPRA